MRTIAIRTIIRTIALLSLSALPCLAQNVQTTVTATVKDPSANLYTNCAVTANYQDPAPSPSITRAATINGSPLPSRTISSSCNSGGVFSIVLWDTAVISYGASTGGGTWQFTISSTLQGNVTLPGQPTTPRFTYTTPVCPAAGCITGSSIDISAALQAVAPSLIPPVATLNPSVTVTTANPITLSFSNPSSPRTYTFGDPGGNDSLAYLSATQSLSNKTLVSPTSTGTDNGSETLTNKTFDISANTLKTATNTAGHVPRNNGTQYVDAQLGASDLSDGVTGTGAVVRGTSPTISTPTISGASTGSGVQGTDSKLLTAGAVSGTGAALCTDANGGATTSGCASSGGASIGCTNNTPVTVSNTTSASNLLSCSIAANALSAGSVLHVNFSGVESSASTFNYVPNITINLGGGTSCTTATSTTAAGNNQPWNIVATLAIITAGSGGTANWSCEYFSSPSGGGVSGPNGVVGAPTISINTTVSNTLQTQVSMSVANTGDSVTGQVLKAVIF